MFKLKGITVVFLVIGLVLIAPLVRGQEASALQPVNSTAQRASYQSAGSDGASTVQAYPDYALETPPLNTSPGPEYASWTRMFQGMPTIERTSSGRLWAAWTAGGVNEGPQNYVVLVTSTDDGNSWSGPKLVIDPPGNVCACDQTLWYDPPGRLWLFFRQGYGCWEDGRTGVWAISTKDPDAENLVWSKPRRLVDGGVSPKPTVLTTGEWLLPISVSSADPKGVMDELADLNQSYRLGLSVEVINALSRHRRTEPSGANVYSSVDHGKTWKLLGAPEVPNAARFAIERMIVERRDGTLWMLARTKYGIGQSVSSDKGKTWSPIAESGIRHPSSKFYLRCLKSGRILMVRHNPPSVEYPEDCSNCGEMNRTHLTAYLSDDDGQSWYGGLLLDERDRVSYPDGVESDDGTIYVIYDRERDTEQEILMAAFTEADVAEGKCVTDKCRLKVLVNGGSEHHQFGEPHNRQLVRRLKFELLEQRNLDLCDQAFALSYSEWTNGVANPTKGPRPVREAATRLWSTYPDMSITIEDLFATDDALAVRWTFTGTHKDLGRGVSLTGSTIFHMEDGKIAKGWFAYDATSVPIQLGRTLTPPEP